MGLGDDLWGRFPTGPLDAHVSRTVSREVRRYAPTAADQSGAARPAGAAADLGAIER